MSLSRIYDGMETVLNTVEGMGNIHKYERYARNWSDVVDLLKDADSEKIHAWMISRKSTTTYKRTIGEIEKAHVIGVRAVYGLKDADNTEGTFQALLDAAQEAFLFGRDPGRRMRDDPAGQRDDGRKGRPTDRRGCGPGVRFGPLPYGGNVARGHRGCNGLGGLIMPYTLKRGQESFEIVDGKHAGKKFVKGKLYGSVPRAYAMRFDKVRVPRLAETKTTDESKQTDKQKSK